jgi:benzodiazapine receptor
MGYAAHRITMVGLSPFASPSTILVARRSLTLYVAQLALNLIWTPIFFTARRPVAATLDITALLGLNVYLTYLWSSIDSVAAYCQIPYLGWLSYATYLCVGVSHLNGWDLRTPEEKRKGN